MKVRLVPERRARKGGVSPGLISREQRTRCSEEKCAQASHERQPSLRASFVKRRKVAAESGLGRPPIATEWLEFCVSRLKQRQNSTFLVTLTR